MKGWPLRKRLALLAGLVTSAALLTLSLGTAAFLYFNQRQAIDDHLRSTARLFFSELHEHGTPTLADVNEAERLLGDTDPPPTGFAFGPRVGSTVRASSAEFAEIARQAVSSRDFTSVARPDGRWRIGVFADDRFRLVLAADLRPIRQLVLDVLAASLLTLPIVLLVVVLGSRWIAQRALEPITRMTATADAVTALNLHTRFAEAATDDEIGRHTRVLNSMFDRLERSFEQASRFTADASHELRTPLTILRGEIEHALHASGPDAAHEKTLLSLLEQIDRLQRIADNLLLLARFDAGKEGADFTSLDFSALVRDAVEDAGLLAAPRQLQVEAEVVPDLRVQGDELLLRRLLLNLVDNAVRYNRPDGAVRLTLQRAEASGVLIVANTGPGIPVERHADLFQRFCRLTPDRSQTDGGSGLGLSLCREIADVHGGAIALYSGPNDLTEFTVRLPTISPALSLHSAGCRSGPETALAPEVATPISAASRSPSARCRP